MKTISNKDQWLLDLIENFLLSEDLCNQTLRKLLAMDPENRVATLVRISEKEKDNIIRAHEYFLHHQGTDYQATA